MLYWCVLFALATVVTGALALIGWAIAKVLVVAFFAASIVTLLLARRGRAPRNLGPDS